MVFVQSVCFLKLAEYMCDVVYEQLFSDCKNWEILRWQEKELESLKKARAGGIWSFRTPEPGMHNCGNSSVLVGIVRFGDF